MLILLIINLLEEKKDFLTEKLIKILFIYLIKFKVNSS